MDDRGSRQSPRGAASRRAQPDLSPKPVRRVARRVTPRSAQGVLLRVVQEVLDPQWSPTRAARSIVAHVGGEVGPLRAARAQLIATTFDRVTASRAIAPLRSAITTERGTSSAPQTAARHSDEASFWPRSISEM